MADERTLKLLKLDLQLMTDVFNELLRQKIADARAAIGREGIQLQPNREDEGLVIMYAAWLYRQRAAENAPMPRMLRYALNNRLMSQKAGGPDAD